MYAHLVDSLRPSLLDFIPDYIKSIRWEDHARPFYKS